MSTIYEVTITVITDKEPDVFMNELEAAIDSRGYDAEDITYEELDETQDVLEID